MGTEYFNIIDSVIAKLRNRKVRRYILENDVLLDFGCGYQGYFLLDLRNQIKEGIGIDYDAENDKLGNIKFLKYKYVQSLPFENGYFSKVTMLAVIEHFSEDALSKLFKEVSRILKKDGKIILTTPTPFGKTILEFLAFKLHLISKEEISDHKKYYTKEDINVIAKNCGFVPELYDKFQFGINSISILRKAH